MQQHAGTKGVMFCEARTTANGGLENHILGPGRASALEKHKTKDPELERYIEHVSPSDALNPDLDDVKDPRRAHCILKIAVTGVAAGAPSHASRGKGSFQRGSGGLDFNIEEALAKAIAQIILARQSEPAFK